MEKSSNQQLVEIEIDEKNREVILGIVKTIEDLQLKLALIAQTIINCYGSEGTYRFSEDYKKLIKIE